MAKSALERKHTRRDTLRAYGFPVKTKGRIEDLIVARGGKLALSTPSVPPSVPPSAVPPVMQRKPGAKRREDQSDVIEFARLVTDALRQKGQRRDQAKALWNAIEDIKPRLSARLKKRSTENLVKLYRRVTQHSHDATIPATRLSIIDVPGARLPSGKTLRARKAYRDGRHPGLPGMFWSGDVLYGRVMIKRKLYTKSLSTNDIAIGAPLAERFRQQKFAELLYGGAGKPGPNWIPPSTDPLPEEPPGCYWERGSLRTRKRIHGVFRTFTLRTTDPQLAAPRRDFVHNKMRAERAGLPESSLEKRILAIIRFSGRTPMSCPEIAEAADVAVTTIYPAMTRLVHDHKVKRVRCGPGGKLFHTKRSGPGRPSLYVSAEIRVIQDPYIEALRRRGQMSFGDLWRVGGTGRSRSNLSYYLNKRIEDGEIVRDKRGFYDLAPAAP